jgi:TorA maturation chaperone TorD
MQKRTNPSPRTTERKTPPLAKDLSEFNRFREVLYLFLSRSFSREADASLLRHIRPILEALSALNEAPLSQGKRLLEGFLEEMGKRAEQIVLRDLAGEYASLFLGVGPETVSLCESAYRHERGLLFQDSYFQTLEEYRKAGLMKRQDFTEPEDHLAVELAFMAGLCRQSVSADHEEAIRSYALQKSFLHGHLLPWVPRFAEGLLKLRSSGFYGAAAHLLRGVLETDRSWIDELLSETQPRQGPWAGNAYRIGQKEVKRRRSKKEED